MTALLVKLVKLRQTIGFPFLFVRLLNANKGSLASFFYEMIGVIQNSMDLNENYYLRPLRTFVFFSNLLGILLK